MATDSENATLSVIVIADNAYARDGLADAVAQEGFSVRPQLAGEDAEADLDADCVICLGASANEATDTPTLVLVTDATEAQSALRVGARGVVHATTAPLAPAISAVAAGLYVIAPEYVDADWFPAPSAAPAALRLTPREQEVLPLLADGCSNRVIAESLGVSVHTARFHVQSILDKFGAESRTEAVTLAFRVGLLDI